MYNLITIKFYTKLYSFFLQRNGTYFLHKPRIYIYICLRPSSTLSDYIYIYIFLRWAGHVARMGEERGACRVLVGKPEGKRPLGRPRRR